MARSDEPRWTLDELATRVTTALAGCRGPVSGRVRAVPDQRTIRYYTTLGLIDRPAEIRGRTAFYGPRHLRQLVAIKRLQARELSLAEIQQTLAGLTDDRLAEIAGISSLEPGKEQPAGSGINQGVRRTTAFWRALPGDEDEEEQEEQADDGVGPRLSCGVELAPGVTLLIAGVPPANLDLRRLRRAAAPLLRELRVRGEGSPSNQERDEE